MSPWVPVAVSIGLGLIGLSANVILFAFFIGKLKSTQEGQAALFKAYQDSQKNLLDAFQMHVTSEIAGVTKQLESLDTFHHGSLVTAASVSERLDQVESNKTHIDANSREIRSMSNEIIRLRTSTELEHRSIRECLERHDRCFEQLRAEIRNMALNRANTVAMVQPNLPPIPGADL